MQITERTEENIPVVSITGDIDLETSPQLREFQKPKSSKKTPLLLLDFAVIAHRFFLRELHSCLFLLVPGSVPPRARGPISFAP